MSHMSSVSKEKSALRVVEEGEARATVMRAASVMCCRCFANYTYKPCPQCATRVKTGRAEAGRRAACEDAL